LQLFFLPIFAIIIIYFLKEEEEEEERKMAVPVIKFPILMRLIRLMGVLVTALVLTWTVHYRGGLALVSANKDLIFNVRTPTLPLIDAVISKSRLG
jgi:hypothetical protein